MRSRIFARFFEDLSNGDPVALIAAGIIFLVILPVLVVWGVVAWRDRKEEQARLRKKGGKSQRR